jgi:hypothetical protein
MHGSAILTLMAASGLLAIAPPLNADVPTPKPVTAVSASALIGTWRLVSYVDTPKGGEPVYAFGKQPIGEFLFTADGHVAISIMRNPPGDPVATTDIDPDACVPVWYCSYFGSYSVAADGSRWTTHVLGGNIPSFIGTDQPRAFRINGDRLFLSETYQVDGKAVHAARLLERAR